MRHRATDADRTFIADLEAGRLAPDAFGHRAHVRAAYVYLCDADTDRAIARMRDALRSFLAHHDVDPAKYHETMTRAWILAVHHFMEQAQPASSADEFIDANPRLLDSRIMLTHYSVELLFSPEARAAFVEPDLDEIPRHAP